MKRSGGATQRRIKGIAHAINILVAITSIATVPSLGTFVSGSASMALSAADLWDILSRGKAHGVSARLTQRAQGRIASLGDYEVDRREIEISLCQMIAFSLPSPSDIARADMKAENVYASMERTLNRLPNKFDYDTPVVRQIFESIVIDVFEVLFKEQEFLSSILPSLMMRIDQRLTELEAKIREVEGGIRIANRDADVSGKYDAALSWPNHELGRSTRQAILEISDWIKVQRQFPYLRLVRSIEELQNETMKAEAAWTLRGLIRQVGNRGGPNPQQHISVVRVLNDTSAFTNQWKLRRMIARTFADVASGVSDRHDQSEIRRFVEECMETNLGQVFVAETAAENAGAATIVGQDHLRLLLEHGSPQASWQLIRRWPIVSSAFATDTILPFGNPRVAQIHVARMALVSRIAQGDGSIRALDLAKEEVGILTLGERGTHGVALAGAVNHYISCLERNANVFSSLFGHGLNSMEEVVVSAAIIRDARTFDLSSVALAFDTDSILRDVGNARGGYHPHPNAAYSEGRYGHTKHLISTLVAESHDEMLSDLLISLLNCADEGVRWGVAACLSKAKSALSQPELMSISTRLLTDSHPWVIREAVEQIPNLHDALGGKQVESLLMTAGYSRDRISRIGWHAEEIDFAMLNTQMKMGELTPSGL